MQEAALSARLPKGPGVSPDFVVQPDGPLSKGAASQLFIPRAGF